MRAGSLYWTRGLFMLTAVGLMALPAPAQQGTDVAPTRPVLNFYGLPGMIDMPSAHAMPDGDLATTVSSFSGSTRTTLAFQITERLTGSFRYSAVEDGAGTPADPKDTYDRSFDIQYMLLEETDRRPAIAVGLRDFIGTGLYSSEYVVATKTFGATDRLTVTGGLGWGRLASNGGFDNPLGLLGDAFKTRPARDTGEGGEAEIDQLFRGDAALFAGLSWKATERLTLLAEYSTDDYVREQSLGGVKIDSPFNFGLRYNWRPGIDFGAYYMYGNEVGLQASFVLNPRYPDQIGRRGPAGVPVAPRGTAVRDLGWTSDPARSGQIGKVLAEALATEGIALEGLSLSGTKARVLIDNGRYDAGAQAIGRTARILTQVMPASVETFEIVPVTEGIPASSVTLRRSDLETLENDPDGAWKSYGRAVIADAFDRYSDPALGLSQERYPRFSWGLGPYVSSAIFDPDQPIRVDAGAELTASAAISPGLILSGSARARIVGNRDESTRDSTSVLPRVRSDFNIYDKTDAGLEHLTLEYFARPGEDIYSRVTLGYLEEMYGGISGEILWKPVDSRLALGAELNYVTQRDFDKGFGFQDYDVVTGHVSAYYDLGNGFETQVDVGRYLAGDWGTTLALDRSFENGWKVGAFATFTDVSADDFGEGSFDKGLRFTIPLSWFTRTPTRQELTPVVRPVQRDGGARLNVRNRLNGLVEDYHEGALSDQWGLFWR